MRGSTSSLAQGEPDRVMAAVRVLHDVSHNVEPVCVEPGPILRLGQTGVIERLPLVAADGLAVGRSGGEQQRRPQSQMVSEDGEHAPLIVMWQMKEAIP